MRRYLKKYKIKTDEEIAKKRANQNSSNKSVIADIIPTSVKPKQVELSIAQIANRETNKLAKNEKYFINLIFSIVGQIKNVLRKVTDKKGTLPL